MSYHFADIARQAAADGAISDAEILELRRAGWADGRITRAEAEAIFAADHAIGEPSREWSDFFVEALKEFVLNGSDPRGYASDEEAAWLIAQVRQDGRVCSMTELELLTGIIEKAVDVPQALKDHVLGALEEAVLSGVGPTRDGGELSDTHVTEAECKLIRRVIFGSGGDRPAGVGRSEAEMLFRVKDATLHAANAPEFKRLFVQGVGNYLMGFAGDNAQVGRERMLELEAFVSDNSISVGRFMGRMAKSAPNAFGMVFGRKGASASREDRVREAEEVTAPEHEWLDAQVGANGQIDDYDQALLEFVTEETGEA